jgi:hypothetical protein
MVTSTSRAWNSLFPAPESPFPMSQAMSDLSSAQASSSCPWISVFSPVAESMTYDEVVHASPAKSPATCLPYLSPFCGAGTSAPVKS